MVRERGADLKDVVLHRIRLSYEALAEGQKPARVLEDLLKKLG